MRYIENEELREWVKESLRKTIFQKAHALAVQTGCEILVKLKDAAGVYTNPLYYASDSLQESYRKEGVREEPGEMFVSGVTGLPIFPMIDSCTQSSTDSDQLRVMHTEESASQDITDDDGETAIPMQLSFLETTNERLKPKTESQTETDDSTAHDSLSNVVVKLERLEDEEVNNRLSVPDGGGGGDMLGQSTDAQGSFEEIDNSFGADQGEMNTSISTQPYPIMSPKPYQCGVCGKAFRTVQVLQKHTQTFHMRPQMGGSRNRGRGRGLYHGRPGAYRQLHASQQARFLCVMCNRSFRSPDLLQDHMTRSHMTQPTPHMTQPTPHMTQPTPVQLSQSQETFDPSSAQTSQAPATATLQSLQQQQQEQQLATGIAFQSPDDPNAQMQMSQSDPSAFNVSTAATSGTFMPPISSSMFQGVSPGASTSAVGVPQSTPSPSRVKQTKQITPLRKVMGAILATAGPVLTLTAVQQNGRSLFRRVSREQFTEATQALQSAQLGTLVQLQMREGRTRDIFVKKLPDEAEEGLFLNPDLCSLEEYRSRFMAPLLSSFPLPTCDELVYKGFVPPDFFVHHK